MEERGVPIAGITRLKRAGVCRGAYFEWRSHNIGNCHVSCIWRLWNLVKAHPIVLNCSILRIPPLDPQQEIRQTSTFIWVSRISKQGNEYHQKNKLSYGKKHMRQSTPKLHHNFFGGCLVIESRTPNTHPGDTPHGSSSNLLRSARPAYGAVVSRSGGKWVVSGGSQHLPIFLQHHDPKVAKFPVMIHDFSKRW